MVLVCLPWITLVVIGFVLLQVGMEIGERTKRPSSVKGESDDAE